MNDLHIASCVAFAYPHATERVAKTIVSSGLAEVPRHDTRGRLVVLIEARTSGRVLEIMDAIRTLDGVLAVHLAYQHAENENDLREPQQ